MGDYTEKATLDIYYDNPNEASDIYLKWLTKDCEANEIDVRVYNNIHDYCDVDKMGDGELFLEPTIVKGLEMYKGNPTNVDNPSATAQGIYNYITENYPNRERCILVIGRGLVGKQLIDKLINYGYTVIETNSKTSTTNLRALALLYADIIVGLSNKDNIFEKDWCDRINNLDKILIDASNNFDTKDKLKCGKWTRKIIVDRVKKLHEQHVKESEV
jgi:5,10-methylene-tetrahydrofolate dehydrogenase/methenyl tetrahydrofolate cyclohydrolase